MCNSSDDVQKIAPHGVSYFGLWNLIAGDSNHIIYALADVLNVWSLDRFHSTPWCLVLPMSPSPYNACISIAFTTPPSDPCSVVCVGKAISIYIWEDDIPPPLMTPVLTLNSPLWTLLTKTNCKGGPSGRRTIFKVVDNQSTSDNVFTNWSLVVVNCLSCCLRCTSESIIHILSKGVHILTWGCNSTLVLS